MRLLCTGGSNELISKLAARLLSFVILPLHGIERTLGVAEELPRFTRYCLVVTVPSPLFEFQVVL